MMFGYVTLALSSFGSKSLCLSALFVNTNKLHKLTVLVPIEK